MHVRIMSDSYESRIAETLFFCFELKTRYKPSLGQAVCPVCDFTVFNEVYVGPGFRIEEADRRRVNFARLRFLP